MVFPIRFGIKNLMFFNWSKKNLSSVNSPSLIFLHNNSDVFSAFSSSRFSINFAIFIAKSCDNLAINPILLKNFNHDSSQNSGGGKWSFVNTNLNNWLLGSYNSLGALKNPSRIWINFKLDSVLIKLPILLLWSLKIRDLDTTDLT